MTNRTPWQEARLEQLDEARKLAERLPPLVCAAVLPRLRELIVDVALFSTPWSASNAVQLERWITAWLCELRQLRVEKTPIDG